MREKMLLILYVPEEAPIRQRMLYPSNKINIKSALSGIQVEMDVCVFRLELSPAHFLFRLIVRTCLILKFWHVCVLEDPTLFCMCSDERIFEKPFLSLGNVLQ